MDQTMPLFIAEASSNHARDLDRCLRFVDVSADIGCGAVKFQLFRIDELFAPEVLQTSGEHRRRKDWELPLEFVPEIAKRCRERNMLFSCTPFYLDAVEELRPYVDFYKIASYELLWLDLVRSCAATGVSTILSTGMADLAEIDEAVQAFSTAGGKDLTLLHCVSGYPAPPAECNLAAIETIRAATGLPVGWSDHSRTPGVIQRAIHRFSAQVVEFHLDLDEQGAEYETGHCWLPAEIEPVIRSVRESLLVDGDGEKKATKAEIHDRGWRADPADGLRPLIKTREEWRQSHGI